jgi:hypothetical protein
VTGDTGKVAVDYSAGAEVGVGSIIATLAVTGGATTSHSIAVRGSKPSGSHFYFACEKGNLPVYTSTPRFEQMICTVRLGDRFGNRIGVSTPVYFATEAGTISAVATTKPFDFGTPDDPDEGSATVTFSTDMSNGIGPADVAPLPAAAGQYPWPRLAEPQVAAGSLVRNPRDQLVTIIAMTKGEEGFEDANHDGVLNINEVFYDQGDPFIDANDDGVYDQIYVGGPWEVRFCGLNPDCSAYQGPNNQWDSQTVIWVPAWVVFTGVPSLTTTIAGQPPPASDYSPTCDTGQSFADIYVYDAFLNSPASGGTYSAPKLEVTGPTLTIKGSGFFPELDNWGAMGQLGFNFDYRVVSPTGGICQAPAVPTAPTACVQRLLFRDFDLGFRGTIEVDNSNTAACAPGKPFKSSIGFSGAHSTAPVGYQRGTFGP